MDINFSDLETQDAFKVIRNYRKALNQFSAGFPNGSSSKVNFDRALENLIQSLRQPGVTRRITTVLNSRINPEGNLNLAQIRKTLDELEIEIGLSDQFGLKTNDVRNGLMKGTSRGVPLALESHEDLLKKLTAIHEMVVNQITKTREQGRIPKKKRKRKMGQAVTSLLFGTGIFIANSYSVFRSKLPQMAFSYSVGLAALHQAVRDFVGEHE